MYCSIRFYVDNLSTMTDTSLALEILLLLKNEFKLPYKYARYNLLDPNKDFSYMIHKKTHWDDSLNMGFTDLEYQTVFGEDGDISAPIIEAYDEEPKWNETFNECKTLIMYPVKSCPMIVKLDYKQIEGQKIDITQYSRVIQKLNELGAHVDNSFVHYYQLKKESSSLDGILFGTSTVSMHINTEMHLKHAANGYRHRIMDVFFLNSIACGDTEIDYKLEEITNILGKENTLKINDSIVFSVPNKDVILGNYRIQNLKSIISLKKILGSDSLASI